MTYLAELKEKSKNLKLDPQNLVVGKFEQTVDLVLNHTVNSLNVRCPSHNGVNALKN